MKKLCVLLIGLSLCTQSLSLIAMEAPQATEQKLKKPQSFSKQHPYVYNSLKIVGGFWTLVAAGFTDQFATIIQNDPNLKEQIFAALIANGSLKPHHATDAQFIDSYPKTALFTSRCAGLFGIATIINGIMGIVNAAQRTEKQQTSTQQA